MELMSGSYSEILSPSRFKIDPLNDAVADEPQLDSLEGTVLKEGEMVHFIAKNLETQIRLSSPVSSQAAGIQISSYIL